ncbi:hypothetical protein [Nocardioides sp. WS12]|uniref:hypothetical protein n=1 Tax=Nocardioides sp. WS12 TaxID=2486272 RepID=UPI0015FE05AB|nr:hypothetical protein [Nocardioides sp. WS12]
MYTGLAVSSVLNALAVFVAVRQPDILHEDNPWTFVILAPLALTALVSTATRVRGDRTLAMPILVGGFIGLGANILWVAAALSAMGS